MKALVEARQGELRRTRPDLPEQGRRTVPPLLPARRRAVVAR